MTGVVLIGSGPSLRQTDLGRLSGMPAIGFNRAWHAWKDWPIRPVYYACLDPEAVTAMGLAELERVARIPGLRMFLHETARGGDFGPANVTFCSLDANVPFATNFGMLRDFGNVGATALQLLYLLGYRRVLLVGVDGRYTALSPEQERAVTDGRADPDHFMAEYRTGIVPSGGDRNRYVAGWPVAATLAAAAGMDVRNASPGTALDVFPQYTLDDGVEWLMQ